MTRGLNLSLGSNSLNSASVILFHLARHIFADPDPGSLNVGDPDSGSLNVRNLDPGSLNGGDPDSVTDNNIGDV